MTYEPENLKRWSRPDNFASWLEPDAAPYNAEWFVFLGQTRDSDALTRSNFACALREAGGESDTVRVTRESHWACGWVEWIGIHQSDAQALETADGIAAALQDYPVVDESHWSELEHEEVCTYWERMGVRERAQYCERAGVSLFAARRDYMPADDSGALFEVLRGS